jgi:hypothetical protein
MGVGFDGGLAVEVEEEGAGMGLAWFALHRAFASTDNRRL